jgi:uncharacterized metal-binding protein
MIKLRKLEEALEKVESLKICKKCDHTFCKKCIFADKDLKYFFSYNKELLSRIDSNTWFHSRGYG